MKVLVTRPLQQAQMTAQKLIALTQTPLIAPLFEAVALAPLIPHDTQALIITSPRALHAVVGYDNLPLFKLKTTGQDLANEIAASEYQYFIWLTSENRAFDLIKALPQKVITLKMAYELRPLSPDLLNIDYDVALHYSFETATRYLQLATNHALIPQLCLSSRIAAAFPPHFRAIIAPEPNENALLTLLKDV